jgi:signal transduction histidine kinase/ligand-binding sensor domain-containing protein
VRSALLRTMVALALGWAAPTWGAAAAGVVTTESRGLAATLDVTLHRPAAIVPSLVQGRDGYLYVASDAGLLRFDGNRFVRLTSEAWPGMPTGEVLRVFAASDGAIFFSLGLGFVTASNPQARAQAEWVQSPGKLYRAFGERVAPVQLPIDEPEVSAWAFAEQPGEGLWIATNRGLVLANVDGSAKRRFTIADGLPDDFVTSLALDGSGELWVGTAAGLARRRGGAFSAVGPRRAVTSLAFGGAGLFVGSGTWGLSIVGADGSDRAIASQGFQLLGSRDGSVLARTGEGLVRVDHEGSFERIELPPSHAEVTALAEDADGGLWVGTRASGLAQLTPRRLWNLGSLEGLTSNVPFAVLRASDGALWATTTSAVTRIAGTRLEHHPYGRDVPAWALRSIAETPDRTLWFGDWDGRLVRRTREGRFEALPIALPERGRHILKLAATRTGDLVIGLSPAGLVRVRAEALQAAGARALPLEPERLDDRGACPGLVAGVVEDGSGALWIASVEGGVGRIAGDGRGSCLRPADGLPPGPIANVTRDARGTIWAVARRSPTLARWTGERFEAIELAMPERPRELFGLLDDGAGHLWVTSSAGILRVDGAELARARPGGAPVPAQLYDVRDGMRSHECVSDFSPTGALDGQGRVWFATLLGLVGLTTREAPPRAPTRARVDLARSGGVRLPVSTDAPIVIGPGRTDLELGFTAPTFVAPHRLTLEYRLTGVHDWRVAGPERLVVYPVLPHGRFTFEVQARDELRRPLAAPSRYAIEVRPAWWQTRPFAVGVVVAALALLALAVRLRVRSLRARYEAIHAERGRIARDLHDSLAQGFTSIGYHLDTAQTLLPRDPRDVGAILHRARTILDHCRLETRRAIWNLRAQSAARVSLVGALARTIEEARAQGLGAVELRVAGAAPADEPAIWEQEVPLIVQEAIANAFRHGSARRVEVTLAFSGASEGGGFRLVVRDDGRGLPTTGAPAGGFGTFSMRDRAARFGGTVTIENRSEGAGAEVRVDVPGPAPPPDAPLGDQAA